MTTNNHPSYNTRSPEESERTELAAVRMRIGRLESEIRGLERAHSQVRDAQRLLAARAELTEAKSKAARLTR